MMFYGLVDTYREKKFGKQLGKGDLFIKITDLGSQAHEKILKGDENDPLRYYYDVISGNF